MSKKPRLSPISDDPSSVTGRIEKANAGKPSDIDAIAYSRKAYFVPGQLFVVALTGAAFSAGSVSDGRGIAA